MLKLVINQKFEIFTKYLIYQRDINFNICKQLSKMYKRITFVFFVYIYLSFLSYFRDIVLKNYYLYLYYTILLQKFIIHIKE